MSPTFLSTLALFFFSYTYNVNASWSMKGSNILTARMDSLVSPNKTAAHVHDVIGGSNFAATYDPDKLRQSPCSSIEVQDDKSNYWAPSLYYKHKDTGKYELVPTHWAIYYLHRGDEAFEPFPPDFRMIAGSASKTKANSTDDNAFNYHCLSDGDNAETLELPKRQCDAIRIQIMFPPCWNGQDSSSPNNKDHVSYPIGSSEFGKCPDTHRHRFITIFLEHIADTKNFPYYDGAFSLSTGDGTGYSSHADFQNGWNQEVLKEAINTCKSGSAGLDDCDVLKKSRSLISDVCRFTTKLPVEDVGFYGNLDKIPGDNPPWGNGVPKKPTGDSGDPPWGSAFATLPNGWEYHGCIDEGNAGSKSLVGDTFTDPLMNAGLCVDRCDKGGFALAGLQDGKECNCAKALTNGGKMDLVDPWKCGSVCPGNPYEFCGQSRKINLYKKTGVANASNNPYPAVGSKFTQVFKNNGTSSPLNVAAIADPNTPMSTTSTNAPQTSNPPSSSTSGSNGPMGPKSAAPLVATPPTAATTPQTSNPPSSSTSSSNDPMGPKSAAPPIATPPTAATTPQTSNPAPSSASGSHDPMGPKSAALPTTTPPTAATMPQISNPPSSSASSSSDPKGPQSAAPPTATPSTPVCHSPKMVKRVPSFLKRDPVEGFHVPAKHRRMHH